MKLYIAEKPSLGAAIVAALPKPHHKAEGCVYVGHKDRQKCDVVTWCIGHILEQANPEHYDSGLKTWSFSGLPILPEALKGSWQLVPKKQTRKQLSVIKALLKQTSQIVHCGDPDREGQLLVDEVLHYLRVPKAKLETAQRCLISDLNLPAVKRALSQLQSNQAFAALSVSALARSRADWLHGMNLTRAFTLQAKQSGFSGLISVGRVQTPVLGLVVRRDQEIENFRPHAYYQVDAHLRTASGECFTARWQPSDACEPYMDDQGRVVNQALAENVARRIQNKPAQVEVVKADEKKQAAPLPYNLSALQIDAAKRFGMSAKAVLDTCQNLYERHKLITYPRSDCRYLPEAHLSAASRIVANLAEVSGLKEGSKQANFSLKSRAWNDKKVGAHHAIIPTEKSPQVTRLSAAERNIYELIGRQYLMQFFAAWRYRDLRVDLRIEGGLFIAKSRQTLELGWKQLMPSGNEAKPEEGRSTALPLLSKGQSLQCDAGEVLSKMTEAPKPFTDASLLAAMTGIARFVEDAELKKVLKETDGLGTEATRASIIELLFKRQFLTRERKAIHATALGRAIINNLPPALTKADTTARWEQQLKAISEQRLSYQAFMQTLESAVKSAIIVARDHPMQNASSLKALPSNKSFKKRRKPRKKKASA